MVKPRIKLTGGHLLDPHNSVDAPLDLYVADGRVISVGTMPDGFSADLEIDATGLCVIPGLVDLCARLREPGEEFKATIDSECRAAAAA
jgi:dihydroorotase